MGSLRLNSIFLVGRSFFFPALMEYELLKLPAKIMFKAGKDLTLYK
jgi:hypothetical protein